MPLLRLCVLNFKWFNLIQWTVDLGQFNNNENCSSSFGLLPFYFFFYYFIIFPSFFINKNSSRKSYQEEIVKGSWRGKRGDEHAQFIRGKRAKKSRRAWAPKASFLISSVNNFFFLFFPHFSLGPFSFKSIQLFVLLYHNCLLFYLFLTAFTRALVNNP